MHGVEPAGAPAILPTILYIRKDDPPGLGAVRDPGIHVAAAAVEFDHSMPPRLLHMEDILRLRGFAMRRVRAVVAAFVGSGRDVAQYSDRLSEREKAPVKRPRHSAAHDVPIVESEGNNDHQGAGEEAGPVHRPQWNRPAQMPHAGSD